MHLAGQGAQALTVCTFHAFGAEVLREHAPPAGLAEEVRHRRHGGSDRPGPARACASGSIDDRPSTRARCSPHLPGEERGPGAQPLEGDGPSDDYDLVAAEVFPLYQLGAEGPGRGGLRRPARAPAAALPRAPGGAGAATCAASATCWWTSSRTPTARSSTLLQHARRRAAQRLRGGRRRPVHLRLARRRGAEHPRLRAVLPRRRPRCGSSRTTAPLASSSTRPTR